MSTRDLPPRKRCTCCGRTYDLKAWVTLPFVGYHYIQADSSGPEEAVEYRNCSCGTTLVIGIDPEWYKTMTLHERIAKTLGWTVPEVQGFSLLALRDLVRVTNPKLAREITLFSQNQTVVRS